MDKINQDTKTNNDEKTKGKSSGNKGFRKHNKLGFYRFMQKKNKKNAKKHKNIN